MSIEERQRRVRQHGYCKNCLARSHNTQNCTSADVCQKCGWAHHTLLHRPRGKTSGARRAKASNRPSGLKSQTTAEPQQNRSRHSISPRRRNRRPTEHRNASPPSAPEAKRILKGALKALQRLQKSL